MILNMLVEGMFMRSISRIVGVFVNTVTILLVDADEGCAAYHDQTVRNVGSIRVDCDEIWSFRVPLWRRPRSGGGLKRIMGSGDLFG